MSGLAGDKFTAGLREDLERHIDGGPMRPRAWYVAVGASGGQGRSALRDLLAALPWRLQAVVLIVLHRPGDRRSERVRAWQLGSVIP